MASIIARSGAGCPRGVVSVCGSGVCAVAGKRLRLSGSASAFTCSIGIAHPGCANPKTRA
eukprot:7377675-Prymnesium_polylepis.1